MLKVRGLLVMGMILAASAPAFADDAPAAGQSTADSNQSFITKYGKASYLLWMTGMHTEALNGNRDGTGQNMEWDHFFAIGAKLGGDLSIKLTQPVAQFIDEKPEEEKKAFQPSDPYLTLTHGKILHSDKYAANLEGYLRYYIPISRNTRDALNKGTTRDVGNGMLRVYLNPTKSFLDGKLTINGAMITNFRFNSMSPQERFNRSTAQAALDGKTVPKSFREDMYFIFNPSVVYSVSSKVDVYTEWATGYLRHTTDGKWSSIHDGLSGSDDGHYISPGVYWSPTKKVYVNPYLTYQLSRRDLDRKMSLTHCDVGLQLQYTFL